MDRTDLNEAIRETVEGSTMYADRMQAKLAAAVTDGKAASTLVHLVNDLHRERVRAEMWQRVAGVANRFEIDLVAATVLVADDETDRFMRVYGSRNSSTSQMDNYLDDTKREVVADWLSGAFGNPVPQAVRMVPLAEAKAAAGISD